VQFKLLKILSLQEIQNMTTEQVRIAELEHYVLFLTNKIAELEAKNSLLQKELLLYRTKKDSGNSSIPPSQDPYRINRTDSLRQKTGRKPGGQLGHEGYCLEMTSCPTEIVQHRPHYCSCCGNDLSNVASELIGKRQFIDIPPVKPIIQEHQIYGKRCKCGHVTTSDYPVAVHSPICYGSNIQALTAYFHARQYIPYERMQELFSDIFGLKISSGSLANMVQTFADKATGIYELIRQRVAKSFVVGADESGNRVNGKNAWAWVFQTFHATYIHCNKSRGKAVIDKLFPNGFPFAILIHDCWKSYFGVQAKGHQICVAHLLRELKYLNKLYPKQQWAKEFTDLLLKALELKKNLLPKNYLQPITKRTEPEKQLENLLKQTINPEYEKLINFKKRIIEYQKHLFTFLFYWNVQPDNNASERAVRTFKVKLKVSGLFRSEKGAEAFAIIRSVIDTTIKNNNNVWEALALIPLMQRE
jgi:transposase